MSPRTKYFAIVRSQWRISRMTLQDDTPETCILPHVWLTQPRGNKNRHLSGKRLQPGRADTYPPGFFFPGLVHLFPLGEGGRQATETTTTRWRCPEAPCHHRAQGVSVNPFGYPPLSDLRLPTPSAEFPGEGCPPLAEFPQALALNKNMLGGLPP